MTEPDDYAPPRQLPPGVAYIWQRLAGAVEARIRSGELPYGARLPSREDLAAEYGVSDSSVRRAVRELAAAGLVEVLPAKGVYVTWRGPE
jgi:GntR family transcriptional regulator